MAQTIKLKRSGTSGRLPTTSDLELGEVAINTYDGKMYIKKNVGGTESIVEIGGQGGGIASSFTLYEYTATSGQTTFSGSDGNSNTLAYDTGTPPKILVYLNGVLLDHTTDYTATNGTSVVLTNGAATNDLLQIAAYKSSVSTTLDIDLSDNQKLLLGDDDDLKIYHDGSNSYISDAGTGYLVLMSDGPGIRLNRSNADVMIDATPGGSSSLWYDGSKKFETTSTGVDVTGDVLATSFTLENGGDRSLTGPQNEDLLINARPNDAAEGLHLQINGADKLLINQAGDVGIGNTSPGSFHANARNLVVGSGSGTEGITINSGASNYGVIYFADGTSGSAAYAGNINYNHSDNSMRFGTAGSTTSVVINSSGDVGIGTGVSPEDRLHISGGNLLLNNALEVRTKDTGGNVRTVLRANSSNELEYGWSANAPVKFMGGGSYTERMRIHTNGNIGINETSPAGSLHISNAAQASLVLQGDTANSGDSGEIDAAIYMLMDKGAGNDPFGGTTHGAHGFRLSTENHSGASAFRIDDWDSGSYLSRMYINTLGKVGIGTTSPYYQTHLSFTDNTTALSGGTSGNWGGNGLRIENASTTSGAMSILHFRVNTADWHIGNRYVSASPDKSDFFFKHENTEVLTLLNDGKVGIGTTAPSAPLHLKGTGDTTLIVEADSDNTGETDNARIELRQDGNNIAGYLYTEGNAGQTATGTIANTTVLESKGGGNDVGIHFATGGRAPAQSGGELAGTVRMTVHGSGGVTIGTTSTTNNGGLLVDNDIKTNSRLGIGSAGNTSTPALYNNSDTDTGVYWPAANTLGFVTGGTERATIDGSGNLAITGTLEGPATFTIDPAAVGDNTGTVVIAGNLQVDGTTTTINSTTLTVDDKNITLASGATNAAAAANAGITVDCGSDADATLLYSDNSDSWNFNKEIRSTAGEFAAYVNTGRYFKYRSSYAATSIADFEIKSDNNSAAVARITGTGTANIFQVYDGTSPVFSVVDGGRVGIGTTSPLDLLHLNSSSGDVRQLLNAPTGSDAEIKFSENGTVKYTIGHDAGSSNFVIGTTNVDTEERFVIDSTGRVGIGTESPAAKLQVEELGIDTTTTTTSATTQVAIDTMAAATFRSARYTVQVTNATDSTYHLTEILLIHDGTTPRITEYGTIFTSSAEATFDADISSGNVRLLATPATTDSMTFKVVRHCITV